MEQISKEYPNLIDDVTYNLYDKALKQKLDIEDIQEMEVCTLIYIILEHHGIHMRY